MIPALKSSDRVANLDLLRCLAIVVVLLHNAVVSGLLSTGGVGRLLYGGWMGVDLFFVLSGWLVGGLYWRERDRFGSVDVGRFWARRWLRTIPPYLVILQIVFVVKRLFDDPTIEYDFGYLVFVQNYYTEIPFWSVSWSLAVEEHFYLALPVLLGLVLRFRVGIHILVGAAVATSLISRLLTTPDGAVIGDFHYVATHNRLEGLALGVWAAYIYYNEPATWLKLHRFARFLVIPGVLFLFSVPWLPTDFISKIAFTLIAVAFTAIVVAVAERAPLRPARLKAVRIIAISSYSLYMTHTMVFDAYRSYVGIHLPGLPDVGHMVFALLAAIGAGYVFYAILERPVMRIRERIAPRREKSSPAQQ